MVLASVGPLDIKQDQYVYRFLATLDGPMMNPPDLPENPSTGLQIKLCSTATQGK